MDLVKSKQRVADHGGMFTPAWMVEAMLDLVREETERIDSRFLETMCGGDRIFIWQGGRPNRFIAEIRSLASAEFVGPSTRVPWPDPGWFGGVFPMEVVIEVSPPMSDDFPNHTGRVGVRYGFNNTVLQHIFEEIEPTIAEAIARDLRSADARA